ncbi:MAG TPA: DUF3617 family protein [Burkholderiales bacterium]
MSAEGFASLAGPRTAVGKLALALAVAAALMPATVSAQQVEPGEWDFVTDVAMPGLPRPQQAGIRTCLTRDTARDPLRWSAHPLPSDCRVASMKLGPDAVSWEMECPASRLRGAGKARFGRGSLTAETQLGGGASVDMRTKTQGRRLGPCS